MCHIIFSYLSRYFVKNLVIFFVLRIVMIIKIPFPDKESIL